MAKPFLAQPGVPVVEISRAATFPGIEPFTINQVVGISDDNTIRVFSLGTAKQTLEVIFAQLNRVDIANILAFFQNPLVNWGLKSFQYNDEVGTVHIVRLLQPEFSPVEISDDNFNLALVFTIV